MKDFGKIVIDIEKDKGIKDCRADIKNTTSLQTIADLEHTREKIFTATVYKLVIEEVRKEYKDIISQKIRNKDNLVDDFSYNIIYIFKKYIQKYVHDVGVDKIRNIAHILGCSQYYINSLIIETLSDGLGTALDNIYSLSIIYDYLLTIHHNPANMKISRTQAIFPLLSKMANMHLNTHISMRDFLSTIKMYSDMQDVGIKQTENGYYYSRFMIDEKGYIVFNEKILGDMTTYLTLYKQDKHLPKDYIKTGCPVLLAKSDTGGVFKEIITLCSDALNTHLIRE